VFACSTPSADYSTTNLYHIDRNAIGRVMGVPCVIFHHFSLLQWTLHTGSGLINVGFGLRSSGSHSALVCASFLRAKEAFVSQA
jgi:hypothetical protein